MGEDSMIRMPVVGVPMSCPDCKRVLVTFNGDGTANLAGKSLVRTIASEWVDEEGIVRQPEDAVVMEAICNKRSCKRKRFFRKLRNSTRRI